jgi:hypothetical protein
MSLETLFQVAAPDCFETEFRGASSSNGVGERGKAKDGLTESILHAIPMHDSGPGAFMNQKMKRLTLAVAIFLAVMAFAPSRSRGQDYEPPDPPFPLPAFHERPTGRGFYLIGGCLFIPASHDGGVDNAPWFSQVNNSITNAFQWSCFDPDLNNCVEFWRKMVLLAWCGVLKEQTPSGKGIVDRAIEAMDRAYYLGKGAVLACQIKTTMTRSEVDRLLGVSYQMQGGAGQLVDKYPHYGISVFYRFPPRFIPGSPLEPTLVNVEWNPTW